LTCKDYVLQLRAALRAGRLPSSEPEQGRYLDLMEYERQRRWEAETKCAALQSENVRQARTIQLLEQRLHDSCPRTQAASPKRKKATPTPGRSGAMIASGEATTENDCQVLEDNLGDDGSYLVEHMWTFQRLLRHRESSPEAICTSLVGIASGLGRVFTAIAKRYDRLATRTREKPSLPTLKEDKSELACTILACTRAFVMLLLGLNSLNEDSPGGRATGLVIYESVKMFSIALEAVEIAARQTARAQVGAQSKQVSRTNSQNAKTSLAARGIAHLLVTLVGQLEQSNPVHQKLFDGFAFILFERAGKRLYYCTFGRHRGTTIEDDIALHVALKDPAEIARKETEALAIRYEIKELIVVLERAMGLAPNHLNPQVEKKNQNQPGRTLSLRTLRASKTRLHPLAKDRLQRTLVACMFGDKMDDEFLNVLRMPVRLGSLPTVPEIDDKDVEEWYQKQVWRLVGWDILAKENETMIQ
ncbi:hypothetical protein K458DRAFT_470867, partial [Lentithecium fluviatile CBS 122367]